MSMSAQRVMLASRRSDLKEAVVLQDELPPLAAGEIRMRVDKVGLSSNNLFYAQMGEAPFLKFFAVYPLDDAHKDLAIVPAWGIGTVVESAHDEFPLGERYRGFLHMTNVVQMKARRTAEGFEAFGGDRDKINQAYNGFLRVDPEGASPMRGSGEKSDVAMTAAPGASSGFIMAELLKMQNCYGANGLVFTSASSKLSLAAAQCLRELRDSGLIKKIVGYTGEGNRQFVESTGLYDEVLGYAQDLSDDLQYVLVDVAGDAAIYKRNKASCLKAFAVGGTHSEAESSVFTAFGPSGFLKMLIDMMAPQGLKNWAERRLNPRLEMFFAPTVINALANSWGRDELARRTDEALARFTDAAVDEGWIAVVRAENPADAQVAYRRIVEGKVPPSEAVIVDLAGA